MSLSKILNSLEKSWERDNILLNLKKGLGTDEIVNEFHPVIIQKKIELSNIVSHNKISSFMLNWSNKFVVIALITISAIALSKQAWA